VRRTNRSLPPDEPHQESSTAHLLTRTIFTAERTLEMVEQLRAESEVLHARLDLFESALREALQQQALQQQALQQQGAIAATRWVEASLAHETMDRGQLEGRDRQALGRDRDQLLSFLPPCAGASAVLIVEAEGQPNAAARLGPLEEELLVRLMRGRSESAERGESPRPTPAKVLALELGSASLACGAPAPGTIRSAFTRLRKKVRALGFQVEVLVGGREGYRLAEH